MSRIIQNILRDLHRDRVSVSYSSKNRWINPELYSALKKRKVCDYCALPFKKEVPKIHHKVSLAHGGDNSSSNLMAVHRKCHKILDGENHGSA